MERRSGALVTSQSTPSSARRTAGSRIRVPPGAAMVTVPGGRAVRAATAVAGGGSKTTTTEGRMRRKARVTSSGASNALAPGP